MRCYLVDGVEVNGGLLLRLATREEGDTGNCGGDRALEDGDGRAGNVVWAVLGLAVAAGANHIGLEKRA